jgi:peptidoglycan LD-endopeptidase LytH
MTVRPARPSGPEEIVRADDWTPPSAGPIEPPPSPIPAPSEAPLFREPVPEPAEAPLPPPEPEAPAPEGPAPAIQAPPAAPDDAGQQDADALLVPVAGIKRENLTDNYNEMRGSIRHEALDIMAPRGTPVIAVDDGVVRKVFTSKKGGLTVYQYNPAETLCYYYAHLDRYAPGLAEGKRLKRGDPIGTVGFSGNANPAGPHLHFSITRLGPGKEWWKGEPINPYPLIVPSPGR